MSGPNDGHVAQYRIRHNYGACPARTPFVRLYLAGKKPWGWTCPDCDGVAVDYKAVDAR